MNLSSEIVSFDLPDFLEEPKTVDMQAYAERFGKDPQVFSEHLGLPWALYEHNPENICFQDFAANYKGMRQDIQDNAVYDVVVFKGIHPVIIMDVNFSPVIPNNQMKFLKCKLIGFWGEYDQGDFNKATYSIRNAIKTIMLITGEDSCYVHMEGPIANERLDLPAILEDEGVSGLVLMDTTDRGDYLVGFSDSI